MALGVRIESTNLNGQEVNVTFYPLSGGSIDLGLQTIPFNYYNEQPYGNFTLSSSTYDFTYDLQVSQPIGQNQNFSYLGNVSGETNYSVAFMNFNDLTATIIDLGIDATVWQIWNWYPMSESGYMYVFNNVNTRLVLFTDVNGNTVEQYSAETYSYNYDSLDGRFSYFIDNTNGVFKFFNGSESFTYTYDPVVESVEILWDWDGTSLDNHFLFKKYNNVTNINNIYRVSYDGSILFFTSWDSSVEYRYYGMYYPINYFYEISYLVSDGTISTIKIFDTNLNEISNFGDIPSNTYPNWDYGWYGIGSFLIILFDDNNDSVDYLVYNFNSQTETTISTSLGRGYNYRNRYVSTDYDFWPNDYPVGGIFITFYGDTDGYAQGGGYLVDYCKILYKLEDSSEFGSYIFTDSGDFTKSIYFYGFGSKDYYTFCDTGDSKSTIFSITSNGVNLTPTNVDLMSINGTDFRTFGEYFVYIIFTNSYSTGLVYLYKNGELVDYVEINTAGPWSWGSSYQTFFISDLSNGFYINNTVTGFTQIDSYLSTSYSYYYYTYNYYNTSGNLVLFNYNNLKCRVLSPNKLSNEFSLPEYNGSYELVVGRDSILYVYNNPSNNTIINLYDFNGALLNSITSYNDWNDVYAGKDRYVVRQYTNDNQWLLTMITENSISQQTIDNQYVGWWLINDYILWD